MTRLEANVIERIFYWIFLVCKIGLRNFFCLHRYTVRDPWKLEKVWFSYVNCNYSISDLPISPSTYGRKKISETYFDFQGPNQLRSIKMGPISSGCFSKESPNINRVFVCRRTLYRICRPNRGNYLKKWVDEKVYEIWGN